MFGRICLRSCWIVGSMKNKKFDLIIFKKCSSESPSFQFCVVRNIAIFQFSWPNSTILLQLFQIEIGSIFATIFGVKYTVLKKFWATLTPQRNNLIWAWKLQNVILLCHLNTETDLKKICGLWPQCGVVSIYRRYIFARADLKYSRLFRISINVNVRKK